jgi:hypothetical protein
MEPVCTRAGSGLRTRLALRISALVVLGVSTVWTAPAQGQVAGDSQLLLPDAQVVAQRRPSLDSDSCRKLNTRLRGAQGLSDASVEMVRRFAHPLRKGGAVLGAAIIESAPEEFQWWIQQLGPVGLDSVTFAVHESAHFIENLLRLCGGGTSRFRLDQRLFSTRLSPGSTQPLSVLQRSELARELALMTPLRRDRYVHRAASGNDLSTLVGELVAYLASAEVELTLYEQALHGTRDLPPGISERNGGFSGLVDMLVLLKIYWMDQSSRGSAAHAGAREDPELLCLIREVHSRAQRLLETASAKAMQDRLGFVFGVQRTEALQFAELNGSAQGSRGVFGPIASQVQAKGACRD